MTEVQNPDRPCPLPRRLLAIIYDSVVVLALWFAVTALLLPLTGAQAFAPGQQYYFLYPFCLLIINWLYLAISWRVGNQTLGMKAWRIYLHRDSGGRITWLETAVRFALAVAGLVLLGTGFLSSLADPMNRTWHDRASHSRLLHRRSAG
jgi:uncharacterized RDD family membrane protein YckC